MKFNIPFTKGKFIDLSLKSQSGLYPLNSTNVTTLQGFDEFNNDHQSEQKLLDNGYGSNVTVFAIIKRIAQAGADIPKVLVDLNKPEDHIETGEVFDMLQEPGVLQGETLSQFDYFEALLTYLLASGNTYQHGLEAIGFGDTWEKMEILPSGLVTPLVGDSYRGRAIGFDFQDKTVTSTIEFDKIIQTKYVNPTSIGLASLEGLSPLQAALYSMTGSSDIQKALSVMVKNQGIRGLISSNSDRVMKPEEAKLMQSKFDKEHLGIKNFAKTNITSASVTYTQMGLSASDLKLIESGVLTDRQLCNAFGVSSRLFNDPANSTFNNVKEARKDMYTNAVVPALNKLLEDINREWLKQWSEKDNKNYSLQLDTSSVEALQADQKEEADKDKAEMEGVNVILNMPITKEGKSVLLVDTYGYSKEKADAVSKPSPILTSNENFKQ